MISSVSNRNRLVCDCVHRHLLVSHRCDRHVDNVSVNFGRRRRRWRRGFLKVLYVYVLVDDVLLLLEVDVVELCVLDATLASNEVLTVVLKVNRLLLDLVLVPESNEVHDRAM